MKRFAAVALLERDGDQILCVWNRRYHGWSLPGGLVEEGETTEGALDRELREETSLSLASAELVFQGPHGVVGAEPGRASDVYLYRVKAAGTPRAVEEGCPVCWLTKDEFVRVSPFGAFYERVFAELASKREPRTPSEHAGLSSAKAFRDADRLRRASEAPAATAALDLTKTLKDLVAAVYGVEPSKSCDFTVTGAIEEAKYLRTMAGPYEPLTPCTHPYPDCTLCKGTGTHHEAPCTTCVWRKWYADSVGDGPSSDVDTLEEIQTARDAGPSYFPDSDLESKVRDCVLTWRACSHPVVQRLLDDLVAKTGVAEVKTEGVASVPTPAQALIEWARDHGFDAIAHMLEKGSKGSATQLVDAWAAVLLQLLTQVPATPTRQGLLWDSFKTMSQHVETYEAVVQKLQAAQVYTPSQRKIPHQ